MSVFTITVRDPAFETYHAEVAYIRKVLELAAAELGRAQGNRTSGTILGSDWTGTPNQSLGSWTYTPSGSRP
jgi:hypothetical protein